MHAAPRKSAIREHDLSLDPLIGGGLKWVVKAKCPVVVGEWDFSKITFGHDEGHLVDATISQSTRSLGDL